MPPPLLNIPREYVRLTLGQTREEYAREQREAAAAMDVLTTTEDAGTRMMYLARLQTATASMIRHAATIAALEGVSEALDAS